LLQKKSPLNIRGLVMNSLLLLFSIF